MGIAAQHPRLLDLRERMQIGNEQEGFVAHVGAQADGRADRAQHIAQVRGAGALDAGEDAGHGVAKILAGPAKGRGRLPRTLLPSRSFQGHAPTATDRTPPSDRQRKPS
jgi:hypothetical protein